MYKKKFEISEIVHTSDGDQVCKFAYDFLSLKDLFRRMKGGGLNLRERRELFLKGSITIDVRGAFRSFQVKEKETFFEDIVNSY